MWFVLSDNCMHSFFSDSFVKQEIVLCNEDSSARFCLDVLQLDLQIMKMMWQVYLAIIDVFILQ